MKGRGWMRAYRCFSKTHLDWEVGDQNENWVRGTQKGLARTRDFGACSVDIAVGHPLRRCTASRIIMEGQEQRGAGDRLGAG